MLRLFRDIRRRLIMPDTVRRYFFYALGEIVLVVIGILIALQINNRNELRKIERFELSMLVELETALEGDSAIVVDFFEPRMDIKEAAIDSFFSAMLEDRSFSKDEFFSIYGNMNVEFEYRFNRGPYETIKSKGLDVITNDSLRTAITATYERILPAYKFFIDIAKDENIQLLQSLEREFTNREILTHNRERHLHVVPSVNNLYQNQAFLQVLAIEQDVAENSRFRINQIQEITAELRKAVRKELKQRNL
jgi:hypothetical protein